MKTAGQLIGLGTVKFIESEGPIKDRTPLNDI
jgi:hypothetical protein